MRKNICARFIITSFFCWIIIYFIFEGSHINIENTVEPRETKKQLLSIKENSIEYETTDMLMDEKKQVTAIRAHVESAIAVLVVACDRVSVARCLDQLLKFRPSKQLFPIIVSQGCPHELTANVIRKYGDRIFHIRMDQTENGIRLKEKSCKGYYKIAAHYGWALNRTFFDFNFNTVIIIEDDLDISPDLFEYFSANLPIMRSDPTIWCVSAWNDNGKPGLIRQDAPHLLHRTDFFPGLGWMLTKSTWIELAPKWPPVYWDDWIRRPEQRKGRVCIRPEISRTKTFGTVGVSNGQFYEKYLKYIQLNDVFVPFTKLNLTYLLKDNYDVLFNRSFYESTPVLYTELKSNSTIVPNGPVVIIYKTKDIFDKIAETFGLMNDFRSGIPRTGYKGVVSFFFNNRWVYVAPNRIL